MHLQNHIYFNIIVSQHIHFYVYRKYRYCLWSVNAWHWLDDSFSIFFLQSDWMRRLIYMEQKLINYYYLLKQDVFSNKIFFPMKNSSEASILW